MWKWNSEARRYYNDETGQFMPRDTVLGYVQGSLDATASVTDTLATLAGEGRLSPADWRHLMREEIKREYIRQYVLGIGGREQMGFEDWGRVGGMLTDQYRYLEGFYNEILTGQLSEAQISARAQMYITSARESYERANAQAWGAPPLPAYPGDGSTACLTNCNCSWRIDSAEAEEGRLAWVCYWQLGVVKTDHCSDCVERALTWAPLILEREGA